MRTGGFIKCVSGLMVLAFTATVSVAGPPFFTDDPDPVHYRHWEYYLSSQNLFDFRSKSAAGTLPHVEVNYGVIPNVQLYLPVWIQKSWDKLTTHGGEGPTSTSTFTSFSQSGIRLPVRTSLPLMQACILRSDQGRPGQSSAERSLIIIRRLAADQLKSSAFNPCPVSGW